MSIVHHAATKVPSPRRPFALLTPLLGGLCLTAAVAAQDVPRPLPVSPLSRPLLAVVVPLTAAPDASVPSLWQLMPCPDLPRQTITEIAPPDTGVLQPVAPPSREPMWCAQPVPPIAVEWVQSIVGLFTPQSLQLEGE